MVGPGRLGVGAQPGNQRRDRQRVSVGEHGAAVGEEPDPVGHGGGLVVVGGQGQGSGAGQGGPVLACEVGGGDEGFPGVGGAVLERHRRPGCLQLGQVGAEPAGELGGEGGEAGRSRRWRNGATVSPGARRRIRMTTARSSMVSGMAPILVLATVRQGGDARLLNFDARDP